MDWKNIDLTSRYERSLNVLENYTFDILLLEINCNLREINKETVTKHFNEMLEAKINDAKEVFKNNLDNIVKTAQEYREQD